MRFSSVRDANPKLNLQKGDVVLAEDTDAPPKESGFKQEEFSLLLTKAHTAATGLCAVTDVQLAALEKLAQGLRGT
jgi:hypothetical protein